MKNTKSWSVVLWIAQVLLAALFLQSGVTKILNPASLPWAWIQEHPNLVKATGLLDLFAGMGLILPAILRIQPKVVVLAAYGILVLMISACIFHISRGEGSQIGFNIVVALVAVFIAWGREKKAPIAAKNS